MVLDRGKQSIFPSPQNGQMEKKTTKGQGFSFSFFFFKYIKVLQAYVTKWRKKWASSILLRHMCTLEFLKHFMIPLQHPWQSPGLLCTPYILSWLQPFSVSCHVVPEFGQQNYTAKLYFRNYYVLKRKRSKLTPQGHINLHLDICPQEHQV